MRGTVAGQPVATTVDSPLAQAYVTAPLPLETPDPADRAGWQALAARGSVDLAALHLLRTLAADPANAALRARFEAELARLRRREPVTTPAPDALVLLVPGWLYRTQPGTGADLARPRRVLDRLGIDNTLVPTLENGTVEANAAIVAAAVRAAPPCRPLIVVSASKGGPEVAEALGHLLSPAATARVRAWVNVGGLLRGTPLADLGTTWPTSWLAALYFAAQELPVGDSVASLRTDRSAARLARQRLPPGLRLVNLVGIPLSGHIRPHTEFGYARLKAYGPNDALTPIPDALALGGTTIALLGLDHYLADPELDLKTAALALVLLGEIAAGETGCDGGTAAAPATWAELRPLTWGEARLSVHAEGR